MREIQSGGAGMEIAIGLLAILAEISVLTFMLMKEFFLPFIGQCVCDFYGKVRDRYGK